jgi:hypothetical protein
MAACSAAYGEGSGAPADASRDTTHDHKLV